MHLTYLKGRNLCNSIKDVGHFNKLLFLQSKNVFLSINIRNLWAMMNLPKVFFLVWLSCWPPNTIFLQHQFSSSLQESHCLIDIIESIICYVSSFPGTLCQNSIQITCIRYDFLVANLKRLKTQLMMGTWQLVHRISALTDCFLVKCSQLILSTKLPRLKWFEIKILKCISKFS